MHLLGTSVSVLSTSRVLLSLIPYLLTRLDIKSIRETDALRLTLREARNVVLRGIGIGYACAWVGHFFVEKNRPATFKVSFPALAWVASKQLVSVSSEVY